PEPRRDLVRELVDVDERQRHEQLHEHRHRALDVVARESVEGGLKELLLPLAEDSGVAERDEDELAVLPYDDLRGCRNLAEKQTLEEAPPAGIEQPFSAEPRIDVHRLEASKHLGVL